MQHARRLLGIKRWTPEAAIREGALGLTVGERKPSRARFIAAAMVMLASNGGGRSVVDRIDLREVARVLAWQLEDEELDTLTPRRLVRLSARAVGMPAADVRRLLASPDQQESGETHAEAGSGHSASVRRARARRSVMLKDDMSRGDHPSSVSCAVQETAKSPESLRRARDSNPW